MNTIQIKVDSTIKNQVEATISQLKSLDVTVDVADINECSNINYLYEQSVLFVKGEDIHLLRSMLYYQTPFLLPSILTYNDSNLAGVLLYLTGKYEEAISYFSDCYLSSIAQLTLAYQNKESAPKQLLRNLIDHIAEDSVYYSNMAVSQHYGNSDVLSLNKLKYLYEQALKYINDPKDELHLLKYYMLLYTQYDLFDEAKTILRHSLLLNEPLAYNFRSMLDTAYLSHIQQKNGSLSFHDVPYYFGNSITN